MGTYRSETTAIVVLLVAFVAMAGWVFYTFSDTEEYFPRRSTLSPKSDGCMALFELLEQTGIEARRYGGNEYHYPEDGCIVIVDPSMSDAGMMIFQPVSIKQLLSWVEGGGSLVIASEADSLTLGYRLSKEFDGFDTSDIFDPDLTRAIGEDEKELEFPEGVLADEARLGDTGNATAMLREFMSGKVYSLPQNRPLLLQDVQHIETAEDMRYYGGSGTVLLATNPSRTPVVVQREYGDGELIWITRPEILSNDWIDRADNHRLLLGLLVYAARGGPVTFDEHIHGFRSESYNAGSIITQTAGGRLLLLLGVAVLVIFLGGAIRPARFLPKPPPPRRQASEIILAQADLYRRAGLVHNTSRLLIDGLRRQYMKYLHTAAPPDNSVLSAAIEEAGASTKPVQYLLTCLKSGELPGNQAELLRLANGCWTVQQRLYRLPN